MYECFCVCVSSVCARSRYVVVARGVSDFGDGSVDRGSFFECWNADDVDDACPSRANRIHRAITCVVMYSDIWIIVIINFDL